MELLDSLNKLEEKIEQSGNSKIDINISETRMKLEDLYKKSLSPEERLFRTLQRLIAISSIWVWVSEFLNWIYDFFNLRNVFYNIIQLYMSSNTYKTVTIK